MQLTDAPERLLDRVRKLLAQAEDDSVTPAEAQAFTAKAAGLMAKYGIDRALLAADQPETDQPGNRMLDIDNPWAREKAHLLCGLASALRCQCILLSGSRPGSRVHIFGFASDIERTDLLYTSILIQMAHGLAGARVPEWSSSPRAWRRSWLLGFATAVISRVRQAEHSAVTVATASGQATSDRTALVLADRSLVIRKQVEQAYPVTRKARVTYSGSGYRDGYERGQRADIGTTRLSRTRGRSLTRTS
ncbi:MAG TPA: DUF2786 domain-containing protein [Streptosporangiaceae bacterium]|nr:DUF2786 domain-containing protein [Streptosporangiaceae bacterium]